MPLFDFECLSCNRVEEKYLPLESNEVVLCECGKVMEKQLPYVNYRNFESKFVENIDDKPVYVRNQSELRDAMKRFNDSHLADQHGKVAIYERLKKKEF